MVASAVEPQPRTALLGKLLARALDPECPLPEAESSALKLVHIARSDQIGFRDFTLALAPPRRERRRRRERRQEDPRPVGPPAACGIELRVGKYCGMTLGQVAESDLQYVRWMSLEFRDVDLRGAARQVLSWYTGRAA